MPTYELVNPYIDGGMKKTFAASDSNKAADEAWSTLSQYITNNVPKFAFTLKKVDDGKLSHFVVKEGVSKSKDVDYSIKPLDLNLTKKEEKAILSHINKMTKNRLSGGAKKDDSSSSSSSDSDKDKDDDSSSESDIYKKIRHFKNKSQPLNYLWCSPLLYSKDGQLESVYIPSFAYPIVPYLELSLSTIMFKLP
jgi:hypothetical protein